MSAPNQKIPSSLFLSRGILPPRSQFTDPEFSTPVSETFARFHERSRVLFLNNRDLWLAACPLLGPWRVAGVRRSDPVGDHLHVFERRALCCPSQVRVGLAVCDKPVDGQTARGQMARAFSNYSFSSAVHSIVFHSSFNLTEHAEFSMSFDGRFFLILSNRFRTVFFLIYWN